MNNISRQNPESSVQNASICFLIILALTFAIVSNLRADTLKLTTVDWQPFYAEKLPENGFFSAIAREAFKRAGYEITITFLPWKRALESVKKGHYDGLLGAYYNKDRVNFLNYSDVLLENTDVFISPDQTLVSYQDMDELKKYRIGAMRGSAYAEELKEQGFIITETDNDTQSLRMLLKQRLDLVLTSNIHFQFLVQQNSEFQNRMDEITVLDKPFRTYSLYCPLRKQLENSKEIISRFNKALAEMRKDGTFKNIIRRFGLKFPE